MNFGKFVLLAVLMLLVGCTQVRFPEDKGLADKKILPVNATEMPKDQPIEKNVQPAKKETVIEKPNEQMIKQCNAKWPSDCSIIPNPQGVKMCEECKELGIGEFQDVCAYDWPSDCSLVPNELGQKMCKKCNSLNPNSGQTKTPEAPPQEKTGLKQEDKQLVLNNLGVNIDEYNSGTGRAGDFVFEDTSDHYKHKILLEFNIELGEGENKGTLPSLNYVLPLDAKVFSPVDGVVEKVNSQERDNDYEISIVPDGYQNWRVYFDHVVNVKVKQGDKIKTGDYIGNPTPWKGLNYNRGFTELQIDKTGMSSLESWCPVLLLNESVKTGIEGKIKKFAADWEKFLGKDVYDEGKWVAPGCLAKTAKP